MSEGGNLEISLKHASDIRISSGVGAPDGFMHDSRFRYAGR